MAPTVSGHWQAARRRHCVVVALPSRVCLTIGPDVGVGMYDYVIVGAGSAGCVLAARLTENPSVKVLLLEAGPPDDADEIHIPAALNLLFQSSYDWGFRTVPQDRAAGQSVYWPRGKVIGRSSSIHALIYIRGNKYDYATWRDEDGCDGWGHNHIRPYL